MLSGFAALITAPTIIIAALIGKRAVSDFRDQKKADKEIDVADKILATSYQLRTAIIDMRNTIADGYDYFEVHSQLAQRINLETLTIERKDRMVRVGMMHHRALKYKTLFDQAQEVLAFARAYFPEQISEKYRGLAEVYKNLLLFADGYAGGLGEEDAVGFLETKKFIFAGGINGSPDEFAKSVNDDVGLLERELFPIIRSSSINFRRNA